MAGMNIIKYFVMSISDFRVEQIAESLIIDLDFDTLKVLSEEGFSEDELKDLLDSEYSEETFDEDDIERINIEVANAAGWHYDNIRRNAYDELNKAIEEVIEDYCEDLERSDIASILVDIASNYLRPDF
jgi:hypothetical protein